MRKLVVICQSLDSCYSPVIARSGIPGRSYASTRIHYTSRRHRCGVPLPSRAQQRKALPRVGILWQAANAKEEEYLRVLTKDQHG